RRHHQRRRWRENEHAPAAERQPDQEAEPEQNADQPHLGRCLIWSQAGSREDSAPRAAGDENCRGSNRTVVLQIGADALRASMNTIVEFIQFALAPVFLLTGIAGFLGVLSTRLNHIVERGRELEDRIAADPKNASPALRRQVIAL